MDPLVEKLRALLLGGALALTPTAMGACRDTARSQVTPAAVVAPEVALGAAAPGVAAPGVAAPGVAAPGVAAPGVAAPGVAAPGVAAPAAAAPGAPVSGEPRLPLGFAERFPHPSGARVLAVQSMRGASTVNLRTPGPSVGAVAAAYRVGAEARGWRAEAVTDLGSTIALTLKRPREKAVITTSVAAEKGFVAVHVTYSAAR